jgi:hypothetical protein
MITRRISHGALVLISCWGLVLSGCGAPMGLNGGVESLSLSALIVDPYVESASLCEDINHNQQCDFNEQVSSFSDATGRVTFPHALTVGSRLILKDQGYHNGLPFDLAMARDVDQSTGDWVVSPLTTWLTRGLSAEQVVSMLAVAGVSGLDADVVVVDPMALLGVDKTILLASDIVALRGSVAGAAMLRLVDSSPLLANMPATQLHAEAVTVGSDVNRFLQGFGQYLSVLMTAEQLLALQDREPGIVGFGVPLIGDLLRAALTITDYLIAETAQRLARQEPIDDILLATRILTSDGRNIKSWLMDLGKRYYTVRVREQISRTGSTVVQAILSGREGQDCQSGSFVLDADSEIVCYQAAMP